MAVYLMCVYGNSEHGKWFREAWAKTGKKLDMGKSCIRFKKVDDLALDVIGESIRRIPARKYVAHYEALRAAMNQAPAHKTASKSRASRPAKTTKSKRASKSPKAKRD
jgi:hypothetical protein